MKKFNCFLFLFFIVTICFYSRDDDNNPNTDTFKDKRDGQVYKTVKIGEQTWMAENLKYLPSVVGPDVYSDTFPYYYVYGYDGTDVDQAKSTTNFKTYGVLYNWTAAIGSIYVDNNGSNIQGVCPNGWHIPNRSEILELINFVDPEEENAGGILKDTILWYNPNSCATNEFGFSALPGGFCGYSFQRKMSNGEWWMSLHNFDNSFLNSFNMFFDDCSINFSGSCDWFVGKSVRCIKD